MKRHFILVSIFLFTCINLVFGQKMDNPAHIDVYITPFYNSAGPAIDIGPFSKGLAAKAEPKFLATIAAMKKSWDKLSFVELYVGAICLYDRGYRNEATYWFYTAQYRARFFKMTIDQQKMGTLGDSGFELYHAADAFHVLTGPYINGYAFGDVDGLMKIVRNVQKEGDAIPDLEKCYPGVTFKKQSERAPLNKELNEGMTPFLASLKEQAPDIKKQRVEKGTEARFSKITSKDLPKIAK